MIPIESLIETYGYWALFVGTFLEGEAVLIIGGFAAHQGYLRLPWVIVAAFAGSMAGDQLYFAIGRRKGKAFLERRVTWRSRVERVRRLVERHQVLVALGFRFVYGFRTVTPFVLGVSDIPAGRFAVLNAVGAMSWAAAVGTAGYLFGTALEAAITDFKKLEIEAMLVIAGIGALIRIVTRLRTRRGFRVAGSSPRDGR